MMKWYHKEKYKGTCMAYEEYLQRLAPCIKRGDLDACVKEASRLAKEEKIDVKDLLELSSSTFRNGNPELAYVLALVAAVGLDGMDVACAFYNAGIAADIIGNKGDAIEYLKKALEINPNYAEAHNDYAIHLNDLGKESEAEEHFKKVLEISPNHAEAPTIMQSTSTITGKGLRLKCIIKKLLKSIRIMPMLISIMQFSS
jgi:tetratricopeptide (TPR) repeat protein